MTDKNSALIEQLKSQVEVLMSRASKFERELEMVRRYTTEWMERAANLQKELDSVYQRVGKHTIEGYKP